MRRVTGAGGTTTGYVWDYAEGTQMIRAFSGLELSVAEVGDDFEEASEGGDAAVEDVDAGEFAVLDLADPSDGHPHRLGDFTLGQAAPLAHVGEPVCADLGDERDALFRVRDGVVVPA